MDPTMAGVTGIVIMVFLFMTRMPVAFVMMLVGFVGFSLLTSWKGGLNLMSRNIYDAFASYELSTIPLFILMGQIAFNCGISRRLYNTAYHFLGDIRGGLAMATVSACTAFGAGLRLQPGHGGHHVHGGHPGDEAIRLRQLPGHGLGGLGRRAGHESCRPAWCSSSTACLQSNPSARSLSRASSRPSCSRPCSSSASTSSAGSTPGSAPRATPSPGRRSSGPWPGSSTP